MRIELQTFVLVLAGVSGAILGSFLNALTWRIPNGISIADGRSVCPSCENQLRWWHNVPILSYLMLRGKCGFCGNRIPVRYLMVELFCTVALVFNFWWFADWQYALVASLFTLLVVLLSAIDAETMLLPDVITLPGAVLMFAAAWLPWNPIGWQESAIAGLGAFFLLWGISAGFKVLRGIDGLGFGDVKFMLMIGATVGVQGVIEVLILGPFVGALVGGGMALYRGGNMQTRFPFGPFLGAAALVVMWFRPYIDAILFPSM